jgi:CubicO group peptidase (beta-lactamase class C family)
MLARRGLSLLSVCFLWPSLTLNAADWSEEQIPKLPPGEEAVKLFNGKDLAGWEGHSPRYFNVENGVIVGKNDETNAPKSSTYLLTKKTYRNFRLIFESRLVTSEMHSGIALWGKAVTKDEGPFTYQGHLVMYPSGYGFYDLFRRNSIYQDATGAARRVGKQHDWNQMEILAIGRRIRHVVNGTLVADWSDPQPELCEEGPIGLQLHSNKVPQEVQWRGLILVENPKDVLVTATSRDTGLIADGKPAESGLDLQTLKKIDDRMKAFVAKKQAGGVVTLVARRGRVVHLGAVGEANMAEKKEMKTDTLFRIASMTKPITAAAVMICRDDGKLQLDDPVSKYIPAFKETKVKGGARPAREITIRDCLRHTNGLVSDQRTTGTLEKTVDDLARSELAFDPGTKWQYGPGLSVAGRIVEIVAGKPFDQFLSERIFQPLGMKDTTFFPTTDQAARTAIVYKPTADKSDIEPAESWIGNEKTPNPSGGLMSTASDLVRFYQMCLNGGQLDGKRILSAEAVKEMTSVQTADVPKPLGFTPGSEWGLGFALVSKPEGATAMLSPGTFGHGGAFGTQGWIDPKQEMIYVLLIARQGFPGGDASDIRREFQQLAADAIKD